MPIHVHSQYSSIKSPFESEQQSGWPKELANPELKNKDLENEQKRSVIKIQIEEKKLEK